MKKQYITPVTEFTEIVAISMMAVSLNNKAADDSSMLAPKRSNVIDFSDTENQFEELNNSIDIK